MPKVYNGTERRKRHIYHANERRGHVRASRHQEFEDTSSTISGLATAGALLMETFSQVPDSSPDSPSAITPDTPSPDFGSGESGGGGVSSDW